MASFSAQEKSTISTETAFVTFLVNSHTSPVPRKVYGTFTLKEDVLREFSREVQHAMEEYIHHEFKSLEILEVLAGGKMTSPIS